MIPAMEERAYGKPFTSRCHLRRAMDVTELPTCSGGLSSLRQLAVSKAHLFAVAERAGFNEPDDPELAAHPLWRSFAVHYNTCTDCNEF